MKSFMTQDVTERRSEAVYECGQCKELHAACMLLFTAHAVHAVGEHVGRVMHVVTHESEPS